jgi:hypothetical protein
VRDWRTTAVMTSIGGQRQRRLDDGGVVEVDVHVMCGKVGEGGRAVVRSGSFFFTRAAEGRADSRGAEPRRKVDLRTNFFLHFILFRSREEVEVPRPRLVHEQHRALLNH